MKLNILRVGLVVSVLLLFIPTASATCTTGGQTGYTINIGNCQNLSDLSLLVNNATALSNVGAVWTLGDNVTLINNNTANRFWFNYSEVTELRITSDHRAGGNISGYYLTNGQTEIQGINDSARVNITAWNTTSNTPESLPTTTWIRSDIYAYGANSKMNLSWVNASNLGYSATSHWGVSYIGSTNNTISNSIFSYNFRGLFIDPTSHYNNISDNIVLNASAYGIVIDSNNNYLNNNIVNFTNGYPANAFQTDEGDNNIYINNKAYYNVGAGMLFGYSASNNTISGSISNLNAYGFHLSSTTYYNNITNSIIKSNSNTGVYLTSNNNVFTNNTISGNAIGIYNSGLNNSIVNGSVDSSTTRDYGLYTNELFVNNTNFSYGRKILLSDNTTAFNYSNGTGVKISTKVNVSPSNYVVTIRTISNWTAENITFSETHSGTAKSLNYSGSEFSSNTQYQIWNGTNIDYNLTTDGNGVLPSFIINFTTAAKTVKILQVVSAPPSGNTFNQSVYNTGWQSIFINSTQNMTSIRSMMNSSNLQWISYWNATSQKWEVYKAGWSIRATQNIISGLGVYTKFTNNDTVNRSNASGSYFWDVKLNNNLVGLDFNGSKTLSQINTSINSLGTCDVDLITYINLINMTQYTFTCPTGGNDTVNVNQGEAFWVNGTTTFNRSRTW